MDCADVVCACFASEEEQEGEKASSRGCSILREVSSVDPSDGREGEERAEGIRAVGEEGACAELHGYRKRRASVYPRELTTRHDEGVHDVVTASVLVHGSGCAI